MVQIFSGFLRILALIVETHSFRITRAIYTTGGLDSDITSTTHSSESEKNCKTLSLWLYHVEGGFSAHTAMPPLVLRNLDISLTPEKITIMQIILFQLKSFIPNLLTH